MLGNPVPGTSWAHCGGYDADSGLDILVPTGTPVYAPADGVSEYAERGHTPWEEDTDLNTPGFQGPSSIRIRLARPIVVDGVTYPWIWYTHLQDVAAQLRDRYEVPVKAGSLIGRSGIGNRVPHLHFGIIADQAQTRTMPWRQVAAQIWGPRDGKPVEPLPTQSHPPTRRLKVFVHDGKASVVVNGVVHPAKVVADGAPIDKLEVRAEY